MKYSAILVDPPWPFEVWNKATGNGRSAESHYKTMTWNDLFFIGAKIHALAAANCALFVWCCRPSQHQALETVLHYWNLGAEKKDRWVYKTEVFTWVKTTKANNPAMGMGYWSRANTEGVLLFTRGKVKRKDKGVPQVVMSPRTKHSAKPEEVQDRIERLVPGPYLELFSRRYRENWDCRGIELDGVDIRDYHEGSTYDLRTGPEEPQEAL